MSQLIVKCLCGVKLSTTVDKAGSIMCCPKCKQQFRVPGGAPSQPAAPDLSSLDCLSLPGPIAPSSATTRRRPPGHQADHSNAVPQYRSLPHTKAHGSSLTSDRALRNTIIGSIVAITTLIVAAAGWVAYEKFAPQISELLKSMDADTTSPPAQSSADPSASSFLEASGESSISPGGDIEATGDYVNLAAQPMSSSAGTNEARTKQTIESIPDQTSQDASLFTPVRGSSTVLGRYWHRFSDLKRGERDDGTARIMQS